MLLQRQAKLVAEERKRNRQYKVQEKQKFKEFFTRWGLTREDIEPNGDCQFLSLAQQLLREQRKSTSDLRSITWDERAKLAKTLRAEAVSFMEHTDNSHLFEDFVAPSEGTSNPLDSGNDLNFKAFCQRMKNKGQHGDNMTLTALALAEKKEIQLFKYSTGDNDIRMYRFARVQDAGSESGESQVPAAEMLSTPGTLNIVHYAYQHGDSGHYESIVSTQVRFSIDA